MAKSGTLAASLLESAKQELLPGERILWSAQPRRAKVSGSIIVVLICLVFTAISVRLALPNLITILETGESDLVIHFRRGDWGSSRDSGIPIKLERPAFAVPVLIVFMLAGPYILGAHFWNAAKQRRTIYVITNQRALILRQGIKRHKDAYGPEQLRTAKKQRTMTAARALYFARDVALPA
jgi:hypothetical protein